MSRIAAIAACWWALSAAPAGATMFIVDPGAFPSGTNLTNRYAGVTLIADIPASPPGSYMSNTWPPGEPALFSMTFALGGSDETWTDTGVSVRIFEARFAAHTRFVSVRMRDADMFQGGSQGVLEAYDGLGALLQRVVVPLTSSFTYQSVAIIDPPGRIASVRAYGTGSGFAAGAHVSRLTYDRTIECASSGGWPSNSNLTNAYEGVTLIADVPATPPGDYVSNSLPPSEPAMFIVAFPGGSTDPTWTDAGGFSRIFEARFAIPTTRVAVSMRDADGQQGGSQGVIESYDALGAHLGTVVAPLASAQTYQLVEIANPAGIASVRVYGTGGSPDAGAHLSSLCWVTRLDLVDVAPAAGAPASLRLEPSRPNPFSGSTTIAYDLPEDTFVSLHLHDLAGRRIRELDRGVRGPGRHSATWDGRDDAGRRVPAGCYFFRLETAQGARIQKLVLAR